MVYEIKFKLSHLLKYIKNCHFFEVPIFYTRNFLKHLRLELNFLKCIFYISNNLIRNTQEILQENRGIFKETVFWDEYCSKLIQSSKQATLC